MKEKTWRGAGPAAAFDDLPCRPFRGRRRRDVRGENSRAGVWDQEEHVQRSKRYGLDTKEVARPDGRRMLPQERPPAGRRPATVDWMHILGYRSRGDFEPQPRQLRLDPALAPNPVLHGHPP